MLYAIAILGLAVLAAASPDNALRPWKAASPGDSRSPCPMLNTLANHGYLPHNGRNLTVKHFGDAVVEALNTAPAYGTAPAKAFIKGWGKEFFDLEDLNTPGILQHISSLSRDDVTPTEKNIAVVPARVSALLKDSSTEYVDAASMARSRLRVEALSAPEKMTYHEGVLAYVEASLVLMMMNDGEIPSAFAFPGSKTWRAPKDRVRVWLMEERLPSELGWRRSGRRLGVLDLVPIMKAVLGEKMAQRGGYWKVLMSSLGVSRDEL